MFQKFQNMFTLHGGTHLIHKTKFTKYITKNLHMNLRSSTTTVILAQCRRWMSRYHVLISNKCQSFISPSLYYSTKQSVKSTQ